MEWIQLTTEDNLNLLIENSISKPQIIFKHSTRCSISSMALSRIEKATFDSQIDFHYLDLIKNRSLSNLIAEKFNVFHESPQILIIKNRECILDESHLSITIEVIHEAALQ